MTGTGHGGQLYTGTMLKGSRGWKPRSLAGRMPASTVPVKAASSRQFGAGVKMRPRSGSISLLSSLRSISFTPASARRVDAGTPRLAVSTASSTAGNPLKRVRTPRHDSTRLKPGANERCSKNGMRLCLGQLAPDAGIISSAQRASTRAGPGRSSTDIAPPAGHEEWPAHRNACREPAARPPAACNDACDRTEDYAA